MAALKQLAVEVGAGDGIRFAGWVPHAQVASYYNLIDILVYPRHARRPAPKQIAPRVDG